MKLLLDFAISFTIKKTIRKVVKGKKGKYLSTAVVIAMALM
jgi:hypothetical protein